MGAERLDRTGPHRLYRDWQRGYGAGVRGGVALRRWKLESGARGSSRLKELHYGDRGSREELVLLLAAGSCQFQAVHLSEQLPQKKSRQLEVAHVHRLSRLPF